MLRDILKTALPGTAYGALIPSSSMYNHIEFELPMQNVAAMSSVNALCAEDMPTFAAVAENASAPMPAMAVNASAPVPAMAAAPSAPLTGVTPLAIDDEWAFEKPMPGDKVVLPLPYPELPTVEGVSTCLVEKPTANQTRPMSIERLRAQKENIKQNRKGLGSILGRMFTDKEVSGQRGN